MNVNGILECPQIQSSKYCSRWACRTERKLSKKYCTYIQSCRTSQKPHNIVLNTLSPKIRTRLPKFHSSPTKTDLQLSWRKTYRNHVYITLPEQVWNKKHKLPDIFHLYVPTSKSITTKTLSILALPVLIHTTKGVKHQLKPEQTA